MIREGEGMTFDEVAPDDVVRDLHQCNRMCRQLPTLGKIGNDWIVSCICSSIQDEDMLTALLRWNQFNLIKRITPKAKLAALRELNRKIREKEGLSQ